MPELPEVETIRGSLWPRIAGARIRRVAVRERRLRRPIAADFEARLQGRRIDGIERRGKYLLFQLDDRQTLLVHLGMSGHLAVKPARARDARHDHVRLALDQDLALVFNDPRRFGLMRVGHIDEFAELRSVGRDPLSEHWTAGTRR